MEAAPFHVAVMVSSVAKGPLAHFQNWWENQTAELNKNIKRCAHSAYMGPTVLSQLIGGKAQSIAAEFDGLLHYGALTEAQQWGSIFKVLYLTFE